MFYLTDIRAHIRLNMAVANRVEGTGLFPVPTSHTTVRTRSVMVLFLRALMAFNNAMINYSPF